MRRLRGGRAVMILALICACVTVSPLTIEAQKSKTNTQVKTASKSSAKPAAKSGKKTKQGGKKSTTSSKRSESSADLQRQAEDVQREIKKTKSEIQANDQSIRKGVSDLKRLEADIATTTKEVDAIAVQVKNLDGSIMTLEEQIALGESHLATLRANYLAAVKKSRIARKKSSELAFLFSADSFREGMRRMRYIKKFREWKDRQTAQIEQQLSTLSSQRARLSNAKSSKNTALRNQVAACSKLQTQHAEQDRIVADLRKNGQALRTHLAQKQREANALSSRVASLIAAEQAAAEQKRIAAQKAEQERLRKEAELAERKRREAEEAERKRQLAANSQKPSENVAKPSKPTQPSKPAKPAQSAKPAQPAKPATPAEPAPAAKPAATPNPTVGGKDFASMKGALPRPVSGAFRITSAFGRHPLPDLPDVMVENPGIDAEVSKGASAQCVFAGKVSGVYVVEGYSTVVIVNHGEYYTVYGNISSPRVSVGQSVGQGDALGVLAADPDNPSHSMIHFQVWRNRDKLNPSAWIR